MERGGGLTALKTFSAQKNREGERERGISSFGTQKGRLRTRTCSMHLSVICAQQDRFSFWIILHCDTSCTTHLSVMRLHSARSGNGRSETAGVKRQQCSFKKC